MCGRHGWGDLMDGRSEGREDFRLDALRLPPGKVPGTPGKERAGVGGEGEWVGFHGRRAVVFVVVLLLVLEEVVFEDE